VKGYGYGRRVLPHPSPSWERINNVINRYQESGETFI